jgi:anaerobic ribonucleoside-triphosphate reductase activating protein
MEVALQEVPSEISLCIGITGCTVHCHGCHSKELWDADYGSPLTEEVYKDTLKKYKSKCSCICFMGGEWCQEELITYLQMARKMGYKTALYTGENWVGDDLRRELDYLKLGPFIEELGGLSEKTTNQRMYRIDNGIMENITSSFWR